MQTPPAHKDLSLKALELFQICARRGSLQAAADDTGLSISTVSHHLRKLESQLGTALFDHARKPMVLTVKGQMFLRSIDDALLIIRKAKAEASSGIAAEASYLRVGAIEDLENDVMPDLAVSLSGQMPQCDFLYHTGASRQIIEMLRNRDLDLGVTTQPEDRVADLRDRPLLRDPFVLVLPAQTSLTTKDVMTGQSGLPYLQFSSDLIIARQIAAQLRRLSVSFPRKFECASNQTLMAMVAAGAGWTITTPLLFSRAQRFQPQLTMHPFPAKRFARTLSLMATPDCTDAVFDLAYDNLRQAVVRHVIEPMHQKVPWLTHEFRLLAD